MNKKQTYDLFLMSWNILAPCLVYKKWYPSLYELAADADTRLNIVASKIKSFKSNVVLLQEAQEDMIPLLRKTLGDNYIYSFAPNKPSSTPIAHGLLALIDKDWKYACEAKIINGILDPVNGESIQIIYIPSVNVHLVNLHLDYINPLPQAKMVKQKCCELSGTNDTMTIMAGDINCSKDVYEQFHWDEYENVFDESDTDLVIPSFYADLIEETNESVDHIFYDATQVKLISHGKAWDEHDRSLEDALKMFGSDHIYVWAKFNFGHN